MTAVSKISSNDTVTSEHELDANSLDAIRSILTEEEAPAPRRGLRRVKPEAAELPREVAPLRTKADSLPPLGDQEPDVVAEPSALTTARKKFSLRRSPKVEKVKAAPAPKQRNVAREPSGGEQGMMARIKAFRPRPVHFILGAFVLLVLLRPWLVLGLTILFVIIMTGVFLTAGYDGFWQGMIKFGRWYANRRPERAAVLHARLDRFAVMWDAILDRFPEGTVDSLYLPDFGDMASAEDRHTEAMDRRLAGLHGKGA